MPPGGVVDSGKVWTTPGSYSIQGTGDVVGVTTASGIGLATTEEGTAVVTSVVVEDNGAAATVVELTGCGSDVELSWGVDKLRAVMSPYPAAAPPSRKQTLTPGRTNFSAILTRNSAPLVCVPVIDESGTKL
jgi:hypothetical protein